jgi:hypothetical protein
VSASASAAAALRAGAAALLKERGEGDLGAAVARADVEIIGPGEPWQMGSRAVTAHRIALVVDAPLFAALSADPGKMAAIRGAFEAAVTTPETALADLALVLRLPGVQIGWHRAYREAPASYSAGEEPPPLDGVLGGAAALLDARAQAALTGSGGGGRAKVASPDAQAAAILRRATLEAADIASASSPPLVRYVVRLDPPDRALAERSPEIAERLRRAVHDAGTRASAAVAAVDLAAALRIAPPRPEGAEVRLTRAIEALGVTVVPIARDPFAGAGASASASANAERDGGDGERDVTLALIGGGEVRIVAIASAGGARRGRGPVRKSAEVISFTVDPGALPDDEAARALAAALCAGIA